MLARPNHVFDRNSIFISLTSKKKIMVSRYLSSLSTTMRRKQRFRHIEFKTPLDYNGIWVDSPNVSSPMTRDLKGRSYTNLWSLILAKHGRRINDTQSFINFSINFNLLFNLNDCRSLIISRVILF